MQEPQNHKPEASYSTIAVHKIPSVKADIVAEISSIRAYRRGSTGLTSTHYNRALLDEIYKRVCVLKPRISLRQRKHGKCIEITALYWWIKLIFERVDCIRLVISFLALFGVFYVSFFFNVYVNAGRS